MILLLACYELGHQPLSLAWPLAALAEAGYEATAVDLSVSDFPETAVQSAQFIGIAVPMHTALRLGVKVAQRARQLNPNVHICFYGLYAWLNRDYLQNGLADSVLSGEYEAPLVELVQRTVGDGDVAHEPPLANRQSPYLQRLNFPVPARQSLPPLDKYARYLTAGEYQLAGYTEASRGCLHTCRHCPVVPVYNGRFFIVPLPTVMADIRQQVEMGAQHITFGDPDFLNGPGHVLNIARALHTEFPQITFDFTTKVEHIIEKQHLLPELRDCGATFIISAFEATSDSVLARLYKGHTLQDMDVALDILHAVGLPVQPTWLPFTPWTTLDDYIFMLDWIRQRGIIPNVPLVQLAIRLLIPPDSALLDWPDRAEWLGELDAANFTYRWQHPDPRMDHLQREVAILAEQSNGDVYKVFTAVIHLAHKIANKPIPERPLRTPIRAQPPRLTEDWFC